MSRHRSMADRPPDRPPDGAPAEPAAERRQLLWAIWRLVNRANVALQLLGGALLVALVDLEFILRVRLGWRIGAPDQPWPLWLMLAIPASVTLLWLTLAALASIATYRQWRR